MLKLTLLALVVAVAVAMDWEEYKIAYEKTYGPREDQLRQKIYAVNKAFIKRHNAEADRGLHTYRLGINAFTDMTNQELRKQKNGLLMPREKSSAPVLSAPAFTSGLPASVDWRKKGWVTPIKNQAECGSCWAFSATGSMEGQHFNKTGKLVSLSEQNLVDCSKKGGDEGCNGGFMRSAFEYVIINHGIDTERSYPYKAANYNCTFKRADVGATISSYVDVEKDNELALQLAVATVGPISIGIDANIPSFFSYSSGIYKSGKCNPAKIDHGVLIVGYGELKGQKYWLVKNSWGTGWGMQGYFMLAKDDHNMCGVARLASFPLS